MALLDPGLSLKDAISRQADVYSVLWQAWGSGVVLTNVGLNGTPLDAYPAFTEQGFGDSLAGIAIGPRSDVDRCWLTINPSRDLTQAGLAYPVIRPISVGAPLLFTQPGRISQPLSANANYLLVPPATLAQSLSSCYVTCQGQDTPQRTGSTAIPATYLKADFTTAQLNHIDNLAKISMPTLELMLLLRGGLMVPLQRMTARWGNFANEVTAGVGAAEVVIAQIPIYGRKHISVQMRGEHLTDPAATMTFRAAVLRPLVTATIVQEQTVGQKTAGIGAPAGAVDFQICDPCADWLILYATCSVALGRVTGWNAALSD